MKSTLLIALTATAGIVAGCSSQQAASSGAWTAPAMSSG
jgi:hypothetical protein